MQPSEKWWNAIAHQSNQNLFSWFYVGVTFWPTDKNRRTGLRDGHLHDETGVHDNLLSQTFSRILLNFWLSWNESMLHEDFGPAFLEQKITLRFQTFKNSSSNTFSLKNENEIRDNHLPRKTAKKFGIFSWSAIVSLSVTKLKQRV